MSLESTHSAGIDKVLPGEATAWSRHTCLIESSTDVNLITSDFQHFPSFPSLRGAFASSPECPSSPFRPCRAAASSARRHRRHPVCLRVSPCVSVSEPSPRNSKVEDEVKFVYQHEYEVGVTILIFVNLCKEDLHPNISKPFLPWKHCRTSKFSYLSTR